MVKDEAEDLMNALLELRAQLRKLQWFAEVNRRGFIKITKKLDKKVSSQLSQRIYLQSKIDPLPFATNLQLQDMMKVINEWLIFIGDVQACDDNSSSISSESFHIISKTNGKVPPGWMEAAHESIARQDARSFQDLLRKLDDGEATNDFRQETQLVLLQKALTVRSWNCIDLLLTHLPTLDVGDEVNGRNCFHRLIITNGRGRISDDALKEDAGSISQAGSYITPAATPILAIQSQKIRESHARNDNEPDEEPLLSLRYLLGRVSVGQRAALRSKDTYGRTPLHYAAHYGFVSSCQLLLSKMQKWGQFDGDDNVGGSDWQDFEGSSPLHLSVVGGHACTTRVLLEYRATPEQQPSRTSGLAQAVDLDALLALATKNDYVIIVSLLLRAGADPNYQDEQGETSLHTAARAGYLECAKALLVRSRDKNVDLEIGESSFGWTPLFCASVEGHLNIVECLVVAGANAVALDTSGWTAQEHAALRGHLDVAEFLATKTPPGAIPGLDDGTDVTSSVPTSKTGHKISHSSSSFKTTEPVKTFGHRYLTEDTMILVSLGSMDVRKNTKAVDLNRIPLADAHSTQLDTALSLVVSAVGAVGEPSITDLPVQENISTEPISFTTKDATKAKLLFDVVPTYAGRTDHKVGRGVALLSSIKPSIGSKRITLQGDVSVPIVASTSLEVIGVVNFNFLIITPFRHPNLMVNENQTYWKKMTSTMVIGHRGLGKNIAAQRSLQLGENTIQSFIAAANLGASYVEFDVQLTKDHVPVIYHDFLVSETGIDAPVHTLTLEQFLHVNPSRSARPSRPPSPPLHPADSGARFRDSLRHRSMSVGGAIDRDSQDMAERMKHTRDYKAKGWKPNSWGNFIQAPFATLEEMFEKLSPSLGFNIEMKYPMLSESEEHEMDTYAVELNSFVDTVLTTVFDHFPSPGSTTTNGANTPPTPHRPLIFSSFNPDICLLLSFKQPSIPILFLTDAGRYPVGDIRASSLQEAIRFASRWNLLGVVTAAEPLVLCPRLVKVVKGSGLVCVSYGLLNNKEEHVQAQVKEGIDAVIVDNVLAIRKGLRGQWGADVEGGHGDGKCK